MNALRHHSAAFLLIAAVTLLLYGRTLSYPFVFDDHIYLVDNPLFKRLDNFALFRDFSALATWSGRVGLDPDLSTNFILRPLAYLTFHLDFARAGMNPPEYRAVNIAVHAANAFLLYALLAHLLRRSRKRIAAPPSSVRFMPLAAALLFLAHPMQIESVTYVVQRFTSLGTFFYLLTLALHLRANEAAGRAAGAALRVLSVAALVAGMLTKEFLFTAPFVMIALDAWAVGTPLRTACRRAVPALLCLPILPALIFATARAQGGGEAGLWGAANICNTYGPLYQWDYLWTQFRVVPTYLRLLAVPRGLNVDWDFPISISPWEPRVIACALLLAAMAAGAWFGYRRGREDARLSLLFLGVGWFFVTISVDSSVVPLPDVMAEHRAYLPSIGIFWAVACALDLLRTASPRAAPWAVTAAVAWVAFLGAATLQRHEAWSSEVGLWSDAALKSPQKLRPLQNLAAALHDHGRSADAEVVLRHTLAIRPSDTVSSMNLARVLNASGRFRESVEVLRKGIEYAPQVPDLHYDLGVAFFGLDLIPDSIRSFEEALRLRPDYRMAHVALGSILAVKGDSAAALAHLRRADELEPLRDRAREVVASLEGKTGAEAVSN